MLMALAVQAASHRLLTAEAGFQSEGSVCVIYGEKSGSETWLTPSTSVSLWQLSFHQCFSLSSVTSGWYEGAIIHHSQIRGYNYM